VKISHRPHKVQYTSASEKITSFAGLKLLTDFALRVGLIKDLELVTVKKRRRGVPVPDFIMSLVSNFVVGGEHLRDLDELRDEEATRGLLYDLEVPAPRTAGDGLRKFTLGHIRQLESVNGRLIERCTDDIAGSEAITLDCDSSIFEVHGYLKEGARYSYKQVNGYHPLLAFWSEQRLLLGVRLRSGNRHTAYKAKTFLTECLGRLPKDRPINGRFDAGFYNRDVAEFCEDHGMGFTMSAKLFSCLIDQINGVDDESWHSYPWEDGAEWTEFTYQPTDWPRPYRMLVKRTPFFSGDQLVVGRYFYTAVITNRRGAGSSLIRFHLACGGVENYIEEFKNGIGARLLPSQKFAANYAWLVIAQLAYNLIQLFKLLVLPKADHAFQLKRLRLLWFTVAARVSRSARRITLALARGSEAVARFEQAQRMIMLL